MACQDDDDYCIDISWDLIICSNDISKCRWSSFYALQLWSKRIVLVSLTGGVIQDNIVKVLFWNILRQWMCLNMESPYDLVDEHTRLAEDLVMICIKRFVEAIFDIIGGYYLWAPSVDDMARLIEISVARGFSRMLERIDCMHQKQNNCPHRMVWAVRRPLPSSNHLWVLALLLWDAWILQWSQYPMKISSFCKAFYRGNSNLQFWSQWSSAW